MPSDDVLLQEVLDELADAGFGKPLMEYPVGWPLAWPIDCKRKVVARYRTELHLLHGPWELGDGVFKAPKECYHSLQHWHGAAGKGLLVSWSQAYCRHTNTLIYSLPRTQPAH